MGKAQFKKGDAIVEFSAGMLNGTCLATKYIVKSCGQKQMTVERIESGTMRQSFIYANNYASVFLLSDFSDDAAIIAKGLECAQIEKQKRITQTASSVAEYADTPRHAYLLARLAEVEACTLSVIAK